MSDKKKYINNGWKSIVETALLPYGFRVYDKDTLARLTHGDIFQFIILNKHRHIETFTFDVAIRPLFCDNNTLTLRPGNRLGRMVTNGKLDTWWNGETIEEAEKSFAEVLQHIKNYVLPFFNNTRTSEEILQAYKKNFLGQRRFKNQIEWGTSGYDHFDFAHIYLQAGDVKKSMEELEKCYLVSSQDERGWSQDFAQQCLQLKKLIQSGELAIETYLREKIKKSKENLELENWLPADIYRKIHELFGNASEKKKAEKMLESLLADERLNVPALQLARSVLVVAGNNINEMQKIFDTTFYGDPRDVMMMAVAKSADNLEYFCKPFPY
jgi:tetratricopeptide (TPR) repeat protein